MILYLAFGLSLLVSPSFDATVELRFMIVAFAGFFLFVDVCQLLSVVR